MLRHEAPGIMDRFLLIWGIPCIMNFIAVLSTAILLGAVMGVVTAPLAFADHATATVRNPLGTSVPGCEETPEGCFVPGTVTIDVGGEVSWVNEDTAAHTVTSGSTSSGPDGVFDSGLFMPETSFSFKFEEAGEYPYYCMVHPWMSGMVIVQEELEEPEEPSTGDMDGMDEPSTGDMDAATIVDDPSAVGALSDGTMVYLKTSEVMAGEQLEIDIHIEGAEHANYDILVMQGDAEILNTPDAHEHDGVGHHVTGPLPTGDPVDITVTFQGLGIDPADRTGPIGEQVVFAAIVPEFGAVAVIVLAAAIVSIVAFSARSRLSIIPRY